MNKRDEIIAIAEAEVGYKEYANNKTVYGEWYGMQVLYNNMPFGTIRIFVYSYFHHL